MNLQTPIKKEPLEVRYNDSNNQKFVTIPSSNTTKSFNSIEPGQYIFPIAVDKRWKEDFYPGYLQALELLEQLEGLMQLISSVATEYEMEKSSGSEPAEELAWLSEAMTELQHDRVAKYKDRLIEQYDLQSDEPIDPDQWTEARIKQEHGPQLVEKVEENEDVTSFAEELGYEFNWKDEARLQLRYETEVNTFLVEIPHDAESTDDIKVFKEG